MSNEDSNNKMDINSTISLSKISSKISFSIKLTELYLGLNNMNNFKSYLKFFFDSVEGALCNFPRKFGADWRILKLSAIFQIWLGENHQFVVKGLTVKFF
jgi:hypothetical protein